MIAFNRIGARQFEQSQKALGNWGMKKRAYLLWRTVNVCFGGLTLLVGALMVL